MYIRASTAARGSAAYVRKCRKLSSFTFAGPRNLDDIVKKELLENKTSDEIADIWYTYHETKAEAHGLVLTGDHGKSVLSRATQW